MRLTVLGGSAASPNTGAGCSGYLVEAGDTRLFVDPGPGTLQELRRHADFRSLSAVLVSHVHLDHMLDLLALRHALAYNPVRYANPTPVWLPPGGAAFLARVTAPFDECDEPGRFDATVAVREYDPDQPIIIGDIEIAFAQTVHYLPAWAMRFTANSGQTLGYTADTGPSADLNGFFDGVDVLLAESTLVEAGGEPIDERGSLTAMEAAKLAQTANAKTLVLTHFWEEHERTQPHPAARDYFAGRVEIAKPGLTLIW